jgi:hypothetical protein
MVWNAVHPVRARQYLPHKQRHPALREDSRLRRESPPPNAGGQGWQLPRVRRDGPGPSLPPLRRPLALLCQRRSRAIIRQNVIFALAVIVVPIIAGATGLATLGPAVLLHEDSTILVVLNALRLLAFGTPRS